MITLPAGMTAWTISSGCSPRRGLRSKRWEPGTTRVAPFDRVKSVSAQIAGQASGTCGRGIGIDPSEYGPGATGTGRIHIFQGSWDTAAGSYGAATTAPTAAPTSSSALWSSLTNLMPYDITIFSCEGEETQAPFVLVLLIIPRLRRVSP